MTPSELKTYLNRLVERALPISTMIWGVPGIGKSSIVGQVAREGDLEFADVRLSQLAPTDLRGLPVAEGGISRWFPPEFLPRAGRGILFLDELNVAPPAMQGVAQQLILDRRIGSYTVPAGWYVWAAGNRKEDRAAVFDMPAPLANRFLHLQVEPDFESFKAYAIAAGLAEQVLAFLSFRPTLLHVLDPHQPAWPSPRSWAMAAQLLAAGLDIAPAVGTAAAAEFYAYLSLYDSLPDLEAILGGRGEDIPFPAEPSARYATTIGLAARTVDAEGAYHACSWVSTVATAEWVQLLAVDLCRQLRAQGQLGRLAARLQGDARLRGLLQDVRDLGIL